MNSQDNMFGFGPDPTQKEMVINKLMGYFIAARESADFSTNSKGFDEDVNLYIAHLLFAVSIPNYAAITEQYLSLHSTEVNVLADMAEDLYLKYFIFKVNADNLLIHLGVYKDLEFKKYHKHLSTLPESYIEDARTFYNHAIFLNKKIYHRKTAIAEVLHKVSKNMEYYIKSLYFIRKDFYVFLNRFEDNEFSAFLDHMKLYEKKMEFETKQNTFLDLYAQWLKKKSPPLKKKIKEICKELHKLDPSFTFNIE